MNSRVQQSADTEAIMAFRKIAESWSARFVATCRSSCWRSEWLEVLGLQEQYIRYAMTHL